MKIAFSVPVICWLFLSNVGFNTIFAQSDAQIITRPEVEAHLRFLASDELMGRRTGEEGNNIAARYIAAYFEAFGLRQAPGAKAYFQPIAFEELTPPQAATLETGDGSKKQGDDLLMIQGPAISLEENVVFAAYGIIDEKSGRNDYDGLDVKGKIVVVNLGLPGADDPSSAFQAMKRKQKLAFERGAVALIELYRLSMPWRYITRRLGAKRLQVADGELPQFTYGWINDDDDAIGKSLQSGERVKWKLSSSGSKHKPMPSQNVIGWVLGTDPAVNKEYIVLSAHYDHVGAGNRGGRISESDSIFNGARDNAIGTVALLSAAKVLAKHPPRRSVIFLAVTGEELGMLGSRYYTEHPLFPLNQTVFNLNSDGAGYNDTSMLSVVGFDHILVEKEVTEAARAFGLKAGGDPVPEQNLYQRSDNIAFASKGIPAINISPGVSGFDEELMKYYHQVTDEAETISFSYIHRFCQAYTHLAAMLANEKTTPWWKKGDRFEEAGRQLFGRD